MLPVACYYSGGDGENRRTDFSFKTKSPGKNSHGFYGEEQAGRG
jgi:hypothetical protein